MEVQRRMPQVPASIFRPSIVVGDSRTGKTDKYDGPYYLIKLIKRLPSWVPFPNIGRGETFVNITPVDFVSAAIAHIGLKEGAENEVYQLADPNPMRAKDIVALALRCMDRPRARGLVFPKVLDVALSVEGMEDRLGVPRQILEYFTHDARYDTRNTSKALADSEVRCPHLSAYMQILVDYFERHPEKEFVDGRRV
jgi:nucleoside-diphosphate-sugar epimerase